MDGLKRPVNHEAPRVIPKNATPATFPQFAVRAEAATDALFGKWRWLHIVLGCIVYGVLVVHIGAAVYFGLRWL